MDSKDLLENKDLIIYIIKYYCDTIEETNNSINKLNLSVEMFNIIYENILYFKDNNIVMAALYKSLKRLKNEITDIENINNLELNNWCDIYDKLIRYINNNLV